MNFERGVGNRRGEKRQEWLNCWIGSIYEYKARIESLETNPKNMQEDKGGVIFLSSLPLPLPLPLPLSLRYINI